MKAWWDMRAKSERILLAIMAALILLFSIWQFMLSPLLRGQDTAERALIKAQADYAVIARTAPQMPNTNANVQPFDRAILISLARKSDIRLSRVQPETDGSLSVWVDGAATPAIYDLMEDLLTGYSVSLTRMNLAASGTGVSAQFTLRPI